MRSMCLCQECTTGLNSICACLSLFSHLFIHSLVASYVVRELPGSHRINDFTLLFPVLSSLYTSIFHRREMEMIQSPFYWLPVLTDSVCFFLTYPKNRL